MSGWQTVRSLLRAGSPFLARQERLATGVRFLVEELQPAGDGHVCRGDGRLDVTRRGVSMTVTCQVCRGQGCRV